jgi:hypothetical protein
MILNSEFLNVLSPHPGSGEASVLANEEIPRQQTGVAAKWGSASEAGEAGEGSLGNAESHN